MRLKSSHHQSTESEFTVTQASVPHFPRLSPLITKLQSVLDHCQNRSPRCVSFQSLIPRRNCVCVCGCVNCQNYSHPCTSCKSPSWILPFDFSETGFYLHLFHFMLRWKPTHALFCVLLLIHIRFLYWLYNFIGATIAIWNTFTVATDFYKPLKVEADLFLKHRNSCLDKSVLEKYFGIVVTACLGCFLPKVHNSGPKSWLNHTVILSICS